MLGHASILRLPGQTQSRRKPLRELLPGYLALRYARALDEDQAAAFARGVYAGRSAWTSNFGGVQYTLGRAWYTHLEEDREDEYFEHAQASDANVRRYCPGLQAWMMSTLSQLLGAPTFQRAGWCGPGIHVFEAGSEISHNGGDVHFDTEGVGHEQVEARTPAMSFVLMLQPPESGGGLRVWDQLFDGDEHPEMPGEEVASAVVPYDAGDLVVIDSYRLHQIQAFEGKVDRLSMTAHVVLVDSAWEVWF